MASDNHQLLAKVVIGGVIYTVAFELIRKGLARVFRGTPTDTHKSKPIVAISTCNKKTQTRERTASSGTTRTTSSNASSKTLVVNRIRSRNQLKSLRNSKLRSSTEKNSKSVKSSIKLSIKGSPYYISKVKVLGSGLSYSAEILNIFPQRGDSLIELSESSSMSNKDQDKGKPDEFKKPTSQSTDDDWAALAEERDRTLKSKRIEGKLDHGVMEKINNKERETRSSQSLSSAPNLQKVKEPGYKSERPTHTKSNPCSSSQKMTKSDHKKGVGKGKSSLLSGDQHEIQKGDLGEDHAKRHPCRSYEKHGYCWYGTGCHYFHNHNKPLDNLSMRMFMDDSLYQSYLQSKATKQLAEEISELKITVQNNNKKLTKQLDSISGLLRDLKTDLRGLGISSHNAREYTRESRSQDRAPLKSRSRTFSQKRNS